MKPGETGHPVEIYPEHILTHGEPTEEVASAYRHATSRVEVARTIPAKRRA
jgi:hypothetical protein